MGENHIMCFLYYIKITFLLPAPTGRRLQPLGFTGTNSLIYKHQPEGSSNSLNLPTPTGRRFQPPFPCPVLSPCNELMLSHFATVTSLHSHDSLDHLHSHNALDRITPYTFVVMYIIILSPHDQSCSLICVIPYFTASTLQIVREESDQLPVRNFEGLKVQR